MKLWIVRSAKEELWNWLVKPKNCPRATITRKLGAKKKISVTLKPQQKTTPPSTNTKKIVSTNGMTTAKTVFSGAEKSEKSFVGARRRIVVVKFFGEVWRQRWRWWRNRCWGQQLQRGRQWRGWQEYRRRKKLRGMADVAGTKRANGSVGCYGEVQSILVDKIGKKLSSKKVRIE